MSTGAGIFIAAFTIFNIVACLWLMWWTARPRPGEQKTTGHVWDGDLEELNNPLPRWWLWLFIITIVFGLGYLIFYPGLGWFDGTSGWSSTQQYEREVERIETRVESLFAPFAEMELPALARNDAAMSAARNLFGNNCSTCHGSDARGARGFPNLTDGDWLWGGQPDVIYQTIAQGRTGVMPALGEVLGPEGTEHVVAHVLSLSGRQVPEDWAAAGKAQFDMLCVSCHGADAKGNPLLGAPDLTDEVWLHGGSPEAIRETVMAGRNNQMPAHLDLLGETKVRLLAAYVLKLSGAVPEEMRTGALVPQEESGVDGG